jgi:hypothetical protein
VKLHEYCHEGNRMLVVTLLYDIYSNLKCRKTLVGRKVRSEQS